VAASREAEVHSDILSVFMLQAAFYRPLFIGIVSMNELERPQARISKMAGCEVAFSEVRAGSARQILPQETWSRIGAPNLVIPSRVSEQIR